MIRGAAVLAIAIWPALAPAQVILSAGEQAAALSHGPWPPEARRDPSNRFSGNPKAIALGEALFFDPVLSRDRDLSCASCHDPARGFSDGQARRAVRGDLLDRNAPSLWNLAFSRWFGWAGDTDSLWAQSMTPITSGAEMAHRPDSLKAALTASLHAAELTALIGPLDAVSDERLWVEIGKLLAAYQETLITGRTPFDEFRDALERGDHVAAATYPQDAQRGLQLFLGAGNCSFCHSGPLFSNGEFHDAGVPYFLVAHARG